MIQKYISYKSIQYKQIRCNTLANNVHLCCHGKPYFEAGESKSTTMGTLALLQTKIALESINFYKI